ncbi:hypothetical protein, partial [Aeromonas sp. 603757]|uniref:hypothetical protein n=1 Tax=Aeromonas sp. 603757 TaxID=2712050 RepID=UPI003BA08E58
MSVSGMFFVKRGKKIGTNSTAGDSISMPLQLNIKSRPTCFLLVGHFFARLLPVCGLQAKKRLCPNYVLHGAPQGLIQTHFDIYAFS